MRLPGRLNITWADDNTSSYFRGLNLCTINVVTLKYNRSSDTASYTTVAELPDAPEKAVRDAGAIPVTEVPCER